MMPTDFAKLIPEELPDAVIVSRAGGEIVCWTRRAQAMFGYAEQDVLGRQLSQLLPPPQQGGDVLDIERQVAQHGHARYAALWHHRDGTLIAVDCTEHAIVVDGCALVLRIVRRRHEHPQPALALAAKNAELAHARRVTDTFLASISHELRTPLNAIIGFAGTLLMQLPGPVTQEQQRQLRTIQVSARRLLAWINDLLDLSKIASGKVELMLEPLEWHALIAQLLPVIQPQVHQKGLQFDFNAPLDALQVRCDRRAVQQIVSQLVDNAVKFTDSGAVRIELGQAEVAGCACATVSVSDTGGGLAPEHMRMLRQAFRQPCGIGQCEGTGLGLQLSLQLAQLMNGQISVASHLGRGSVFTLAVPLAAA